VKRIVFLGLSLIVALALLTGSVLLIGYVVAAASLLTIVTLVIRRAIRGESTVLSESLVPRAVATEERKAA